MASSTACTPVCDFGFLPSETELFCMDGAFTPPIFSCIVEDPCIPPLNFQNAAPEGLCSGVVGAGAVESRSNCSAACAAGFLPTVPELFCIHGHFSPASFACLRGEPCPAPSSLSSSGNAVACVEGSLIPSGSTCETSCAIGFAPEVEELLCIDQSFAPTNFTCMPVDPCAAPAGIGNLSAEAPCVEGFLVQHGASCSPACAEGYAASVAALSCEYGMLSPTTFTCVGLPCLELPIVTNSLEAGVCGAGVTALAHGEVCSPACKYAYVPSEESLQCVRGFLSPPSFRCDGPVLCSVSMRVANAYTFGVCGIGVTEVMNGDVCTARCAQSFAPSTEFLNCTAGSFDPPFFTCDPLEDETACTPPVVANALNAGSCGPGVWEIEDGQECTPQCAPLHVPSEASLHCTGGLLSPANFTCIALSTAVARTRPTTTTAMPTILVLGNPLALSLAMPDEVEGGVERMGAPPPRRQQSVVKMSMDIMVPDPIAFATDPSSENAMAEAIAALFPGVQASNVAVVLVLEGTSRRLREVASVIVGTGARRLQDGGPDLRVRVEATIRVPSLSAANGLTEAIVGVNLNDLTAALGVALEAAGAVETEITIVTLTARAENLFQGSSGAGGGGHGGGLGVNTDDMDMWAGNSVRNAQRFPLVVFALVLAALG